MTIHASDMEPGASYVYDGTPGCTFSLPPKSLTFAKYENRLWAKNEKHSITAREAMLLSMMLEHDRWVLAKRTRHFSSGSALNDYTLLDPETALREAA